MAKRAKKTARASDDEETVSSESATEAKPSRSSKADAAKERSRPRTNTAAGDDVGAAELARKVAESLRTYRRDRRLSLDELSERSGVSRAALSQIEGGRTNPTLAVLWKIAVGLEIHFNDLLGTTSQEAVLILRAGDAPPLRSSDGRTESRLLSPGGAATDTEVYEMRFAPKAVHRSDPHARGTNETVVVLTGALRLTVGETEYDLQPGDSAFFRADVAHVYENRSTREARCIDVIHYTRA
jgi:XRE family transcriptional regulator, regulator of sulfur utilization